MSNGDAWPALQTGGMKSNVNDLHASAFPPGDEPRCCRCIRRAPLMKQISFALQPAWRSIRAEVCGIEAICLNLFEQCRKGGTRGAGVASLDTRLFNKLVTAEDYFGR